MTKLENEVDKLSYALAMNIAGSVMQLPVEINRSVFIEAITGLMNGGQPALSPADFQQIMQEFQTKLQAAGKAELDELASQNAAEEKAFMAENAKKDGVKTTASGLQYLVEKEGSGDAPKADDKVRVHYEGSLLNGKVFDSSVKRGQPAEFGVNQVIPGWTEALQMMKPGSKYKLFIPAALAYGSRGAGEVIPPNAALIFEVELLAVL